jgi:hypothetical protein
MYRLPMQDELARFVDSLAIPAERKAVVLAELTDHVACATEAAVRAGRDPDAAARAALGDLGALRRSLEAIEPAFRVSRWRAAGHGLVAGLVVALVLDRGGPIVLGPIGACLAIAIAAALAPPRVLHLLRGELRARRIRGALGLGTGVPIGPAATYLVTVLSVPFLVWIALIAVRAAGGVTTVDVPWSAFALPIAVCALLLLEGIRARRVPVT